MELLAETRAALKRFISRTETPQPVIVPPQIIEPATHGQEVVLLGDARSILGRPKFNLPELKEFIQIGASLLGGEKYEDKFISN